MSMGIGIIGCGNISTTYLKLAPLFKGLEVVAVADMNMDAARARAAEYGVLAQSVDDLLANPDVGLVINLTIPDAHYAITRRAVEAGKHVYSEKPVVLTLAEGVALRDLAAAKGLRIGSAPYFVLGTSPSEASFATASATGLRETPRRSQISGLRMMSPGRKASVRIACFRLW